MRKSLLRLGLQIAIKPIDGAADPFLDVDVPADPLPRLNDTHAFCEGIIGGGLGVVNEWWDARERPTEGLHGAAIS